MVVLPPVLSELLEESPRLRRIFALLRIEDRNGLVSFIEAAKSEGVQRRRAALAAMSLAWIRVDD